VALPQGGRVVKEEAAESLAILRAAWPYYRGGGGGGVARLGGAVAGGITAGEGGGE